MTQSSGLPPVPDAEARFLRALLEKICRGACVLLLGPGVAVGADDPVTPLTIRLARELASDPQLQSDRRLGDGNNLRHVAQLYYQVKHDRYELAEAAKDFYGGFADVTTEFHRNMASLPFRLCISTTPDDFMFNALVSTSKKPTKGHYNLHHASGYQLPEPTEDKPLVYSLYGHPSEGESLVLTEGDLIEFLVNVVQGKPALADTIRGHLSDPDTSFLFVGFGFQDWYVRVLLHVLNVYGHKDRSIALEDPAFFSSPERAQTIGFFGDRAIEFKEILWSDFAMRLSQMYRALARATPAATPELPADAPKAFICYASEDRESVERVSARLHAAGIAVWRDKQNLRGGDDWDRVLVHVIEKQVDYVIVVQSKAMDRRLKGYFFKEIEAARDQKKWMRQGLIFVVPVLIEPCQGLEEVKDLHQIDISNDAGFDQLVQSLLEDWRKRREITA